MRAHKFVAVERKSFDIVLEGRGEDVIRIAENEKGRRIFIILNLEESGWLVETWRLLWKASTPTGWFRRWRKKDRSIVFQIQKNKWGRMLVLTVISSRGSRTIILPEGKEKIGWREFYNGFDELYALASLPSRRNLQKEKFISNRGDPAEHQMTRKPSMAKQTVEGSKEMKTYSALNLKIDCPYCRRELQLRFLQFGEYFGGRNR